MIFGVGMDGYMAFIKMANDAGSIGHLFFKLIERRFLIFDFYRIQQFLCMIEKPRLRWLLLNRIFFVYQRDYACAAWFIVLRRNAYKFCIDDLGYIFDDSF